MTAAEREYGQDAVYGSLAYDYGSPELSAPPEEQSAEEAAEHSRVGAHAAPRAKQGIAPFSVIGVLIAAFLFVTAMTARSRLLELSEESAGLEAEITELQAERTKLRIAYESAFRLADVRAYAEGKLGMHAPEPDQIIYVDTSGQDHAMVFHSGRSDGFVDRISDLIAELGAYFRFRSE